MIRYARVTWGDGPIRLKIQAVQAIAAGEDAEGEMSRALAFKLAIDLLRALLFGEREE